MRKNEPLVVHCPTAAEREALASTCRNLKDGHNKGPCEEYPYQIVNPKCLSGNSADHQPGWQRANHYGDPVPFPDLTLSRLRTALGLDEPKEPERIELPPLANYRANHIADGQLVMACREHDYGEHFDLVEVDRFLTAYQEARKQQEGGEAEEEAPQAQEVQLSNGLRLRLEASKYGTTAHLRARREGGHMLYLLNLYTMPSRAARLIGACDPLSDLLPIDALGRLVVE